MRISFLTLSLRQNGGGSHQNAILFIRALREHGHNVTVYTFRKESDPPPDIAVRSLNEGNVSFLSALKERARLMSSLEDDTDVFFVYGQALLWSAGMYCKRGKKPVAVYLDSHLDSMKESYRFGVLHRIKHRLWELTQGLSLARSVELFLAVSPYLKDRFIKAGFPEEKFAIIPNAFELPEVTRESSGNDVRILAVGRLSREKGMDILVDAGKDLPDDLQWTITIAGDGPERATLEEKIQSVKLEKRIHIAGWQSRDELWREYGRADIFVLPSRVPEPFGRSLVEALHAGVPAIVPREGGAAWVGGAAVRTFENGNARSLAFALSSLLRDRGARRTLGAEGPKAAARFETRIVGKLLESELAKLVTSA